MIYQLKINLEDMRPPVWRRIQVDADITFANLHEVLQIAFAWENSHLHQFECTSIPENKQSDETDWEASFEFIAAMMRRGAGYARAIIGDPEFDEGWADMYFDENTQRLSEWLVQEKDSCVYTYDFGDDWRHKIVLEKIVEPTAGVVYPYCLKARKLAPEEDSRGGFWEEDEDDERQAGPDDKTLTALINAQLQQQAARWSTSSGSKGKTKTSMFERAATAERLQQEQRAERVDWGKLFELARTYHKERPWMRMADSNLFAVHDERTGETAYCSIMGMMDEVYGLAVYRGHEGLRVLKQILDMPEDATEADQHNLAYEQDALLLTFEDREALQEPDYERIRATGVRFRGRKAWPVFQRYSPGHMPASMQEQEVVYMTEVLEQVNAFIQGASYEIDRMEKMEQSEPEEEWIPARSYLVADSESGWKDSNIQLNAQTAKTYPPVQIDELQLAGLRKKLKVEPGLTLEFDLFYMPTPVQEEGDERPYFPLFAMTLDLISGVIVQHTMVHPTNGRAACHRDLLTAFASMGRLPERIVVQSDSAYALLAVTCRTLGIGLNKVEELQAANEARDSMLDHFMNFS